MCTHPNQKTIFFITQNVAKQTQRHMTNIFIEFTAMTFWSIDNDRSNPHSDAS